MKKEIIIYHLKNGEIEFKGDIQKETLWASLQQIADLFETDKSGISRHIKNIYQSGELNQGSTVANFATVQKEGDRKVSRNIEYYNLDLILSVGYRVNSKSATKFRQWATKTLREHIIRGYTLNKKRIAVNYSEFLKAVDTVKKITAKNNVIQSDDVLELVKMFADTWLSLDAYDKSAFPKKGATKKKVEFTANELTDALSNLKSELQKKGEAGNLFGTAREKEAILGIVGNIFQSVFGKDAYDTVEEKAANLLYFIVKDHPFIDGNKRNGAFAFVWFLNLAGIFHRDRFSPEALTALTLLVAESNSKEKDRVIGLILQLLRNQTTSSSL